jgi:putative Holliday junction resolvase
MRLLAVDPGEKMIGLAVSDPTGTIARPLTSLRHEARAKDAARIAALAAEHVVEGIVMGLALDAQGKVGPQARRAERLAEALRACTSLPICFQDESYSSLAAEEVLRVTRRTPAGGGKKRRGHQDPHLHAVAAAAILQSYLDAHPREETPG